MSKMMHPSLPSNTRAHVFCGAALVLAILAAYGNVYDNAFLLDDEFLIIKNRFLHGWHYVGQIFSSSSTAGFGGVDSFYRPMQGLLYLITYQLFGQSAAAFHCLNILLHIVNALTLYALGIRLGLKHIAVFLGTLLWALHPLHTEAVTYMSATADTLYTFFCLAGLHALLPDFNGRKMAIACLAFICALFSKETALVFPLLVTTLMLYQAPPGGAAKLLLKTWPLWLVAAGYYVLRETALKFDGLDFYKTPNVYTEHVVVRVFTFLATLPDYLFLLLWPQDLHMDRHFPVFAEFFNPAVMLGAGLALGAGIIILITLRQKNPSHTLRVLSWSLMWFAAAHALHSGIAIPVNAFFLEHWMYMPSMGLFLAGAELAVVNLEKTKMQDGAMVALSFTVLAAGALGVATWQQNKIWAAPIPFYSNIIAHGSGNARVHNNLAMALDDAGDLDAAKTHYEKAIELYDAYPQTHYNLAQLILKLNPSAKGMAEAQGHLERAIALDANFYRAYALLAEIEGTLGQTDKAATLRAQGETLRKKFEGP